MTTTMITTMVTTRITPITTTITTTTATVMITTMITTVQQGSQSSAHARLGKRDLFTLSPIWNLCVFFLCLFRSVACSSSHLTLVSRLILLLIFIRQGVEPSWCHEGGILRLPGPILDHLEAIWKPSWAHLRPSWGHLAPI